jgi:hypothetical protein
MNLFLAGAAFVAPAPNVNAAHSVRGLRNVDVEMMRPQISSMGLLSDSAASTPSPSPSPGMADSPSHKVYNATVASREAQPHLVVVQML